jgi:hypothetical protein
MAVYTVTLTIQEDGVTIPGFPVVKTLTTAESAGRQVLVRASGGGYVNLPVAELGDVNLLMVDTTQALSIRFNDQTDAGLPMNASGLLLLVNSAIPSGATAKVSADNASGSAATIVQVAGGT